MNAKKIMTLCMIGLMLVGAFAASVQASDATMTPGFFELAVAEDQEGDKTFTPAPDKMSTRFGELDFPGGYPTEETVQKVYDELDRQRATQLYLDMYPALSAHGLMKGWVRDLGMRDSFGHHGDRESAGLHATDIDRQHRKPVFLFRARSEG